MSGRLGVAPAALILLLDASFPPYEIVLLQQTAISHLPRLGQASISHSLPPHRTSSTFAICLMLTIVRAIFSPTGELYLHCIPFSAQRKLAGSWTYEFLVTITTVAQSGILMGGIPSTWPSRTLMIWKSRGRRRKIRFSGEARLQVVEAVRLDSPLNISDIGI